jgi:hypothetical protein
VVQEGDAMRTGNSRQSFLSDHLNDILEHCVVGVVGLGGGGSQVVQQLAHIGFKHYVLCDFDHIVDTNLNRLVGATQVDIKESNLKINIAIRLIQGLRPDAVITRIPKRFQEDAAKLKQCDLIFGCLDGYRNRRELEVLARNALIPYIDIGMDVTQPTGEVPRMGGQVIASIPGCPCMWCFGYLTDAKLEEEDKKYRDAGERPQVIWPNGILSSTAIHVALNLLTNWTSKAANQTLYYNYDGNKGELSPHFRFLGKRGRTCPHFPLQEAGDRLLF